MKNINPTDRTYPFRDFATETASSISALGGDVVAILSQTAPEELKPDYNICINRLAGEYAAKRTITHREFRRLRKKYEALTARFLENGLKEIEYVFLYSGQIPFDDHKRLEASSGKTLEIIFKKLVEDMSDDINLIALSSRDLGSFIYKSLTNVLPRYLDFGGCSVFLWDERSQCLQLAGTTGLISKKGNEKLQRPKKSDVKYYLNDRSYSVRCFTSKNVIKEFSLRLGLPKNTFGEDQDIIFNRYYFPIQLRDAVLKTRKTEDEQKEAKASTIGTLRIVNVLNFGLQNRLSKINFCILKHFCEKISILGSKYLTSIRLSRELEQAFHGHTTDMAALSLRIQEMELLNNLLNERLGDIRRLSRNFLTGIKDQNFDLISSQKDLDRHFFEIERIMTLKERSVRDATSIHDGLGYQLEMVKLHNEKSSRSAMEVCLRPYRDVFLRVDSSIKDMIETYHGAKRRHVRLSWKDPAEFNGIQKIPPLKISEESLYLTVRNLVENSVKYTTDIDRIEISVSWRVASDSVIFRFEDNGEGISEEDEGRIFLEGWRSKAARVGGLRGTGMGLAVCKAAIEAEGGILRYVGKGRNRLGAVFEVEVGIAHDVDLYS